MNLQQLQENITTVELLWSITLSDYTMPNTSIVKAWFRYATLAIIIDAITDMRDYCQRRNEPLSSESVGKIVSSRIRRAVERENEAQCRASGIEPVFGCGARDRS